MEKGHIYKESGVTTQGRKEAVGTVLLGNDKSNVIVNYLFSCFLCWSFQDKMTIYRAI